MKKAKFINNKFRWFLNIIFIIIMILATVFGSIFYLGPKLSNQTVDKVSNAKIGLRIQANSVNNRNIITNSRDIINLTQKYLQSKNSALASAYSFKLLSDSLVSVTGNDVKSDEQLNQLISSLVNKPYLTITDEKGNPLFYKGLFISQTPNPNTPNQITKTLQDFINDGPEDYTVNLLENPATTYNRGGVRQRIQVKLDRIGWEQFIQLSNAYFFRNIINNNNNGNPNDPSLKVYFWLNLHDFIKEAKEKFPEDWKKSGENPVNFAYINNSVNPEEKRDENNRVIEVKPPVLKLNEINARQYLISSENPAALLSPDKSESSFYLINRNEHGLTDEAIADSINYSYLPFNFIKEYSYFNVNQSNHKNSYLIVIAILFSLFALFLISKYRLLGFISIISLGFFIFVFLSIITAFNISITPIIAFAVIFMIFVVFELINNKLSIFKKEVNEGSNANKAINKLAKHGFIVGLDSVAILIISSIIAIFISFLYVNTLGIIIFIGSLLALFITVIINTVMLKSIVKTETFDKNSAPLVYKNQKMYTFISKFDLISKSKYFTIIFAAIAILAVVIWGIVAGVKGSPLNGLNLDNEVKYHYYYTLGSGLNNNLSLTSAQEIANYITKMNPQVQANVLLQNMSNLVGSEVYLVEVWSNSNISGLINSTNLPHAVELLEKSMNEIRILDLGVNIGFLIAVIVASLSLVFVYFSMRFSLLSGVILLVKEAFIVILIMLFTIITYTNINNSIFGTMVLLTMLNVVDSAISSQRIKEEFKKDLNTKNFIYEKEKIDELFKIYVQDVFFRQMLNIFVAIALMSTVLPLITNLNPTFILSLGFGIISVSLINIFLIPNIWRLLYIKKYEIKKNRIKNNYWKTEEIEEQTFIGINDFSI
ncbi:protein translocase subunit SecDF [Mycoplasma phocoeninasale]|uniref:protein translocase subunit SecDF n=1 Tax=Mycoplasma phocoeninasale TaxID=2726117 RepID=UPI001967D290|nr:peptide transporter [Mycoplasma phocoeninasale]MBN0970768.1 peptide transporter [Mycoplasma phocoeninasale]